MAFGLLGLLVAGAGSFAGSEVGRRIKGRDTEALFGGGRQGGGGGGGGGKISAEQVRKFAESVDRQRRAAAGATQQVQQSQPTQLSAGPNAIIPPQQVQQVTPAQNQQAQSPLQQLLAQQQQQRIAGTGQEQPQQIAAQRPQLRSPLEFLAGRTLAGIGR